MTPTRRSLLTLSAAVLAAQAGCGAIDAHRTQRAVTDHDWAEARKKAASVPPPELPGSEKAKAARLTPIEQKEREQAEQAERDKLRQEPNVMRYEWSTILCFWQDWRAQMSAKADKELRYGAEFGVASPDRLYYIRQKAELADDGMARALEALTAMKAQPVPCSNEFVAGMRACVGSPAECESPDQVRQATDLAYELDPAMHQAYYPADWNPARN